MSAGALPKAAASRQPNLALFVSGVGLTMVISWGGTFYLPSIIEGSLRTELGLPRELVFGGITLMLLVSAFIAPGAGVLVDRRGARGAMIAGHAVLALGLFALSRAAGPVSYMWPWILFGLVVPIAMTNGAFAAAERAFPGRSRRAITTLLLLSGVSSGVMWPLIGWLDQQFGWRTTCLVLGAMQVLISMPLTVWLVRPLSQAPALPAGVTIKPALLLEKGDRDKGFVLLVIGAGVSGLISWGLPLHFVPMFQSVGFSPAAAVAIASLQAYAMLASRASDIFLAERVGATRLVAVAALSMPVTFGGFWLAFSFPAEPGRLAAVLTVLVCGFGLAFGTISVARATLPLVLFGREGFAATLGRLSRWLNIMFALSPLLFATVFGRVGAPGALALAFMLSLLAAAAFWRLHRLVSRAPA